MKRMMIINGCVHEEDPEVCKRWGCVSYNTPKVNEKVEEVVNRCFKFGCNKPIWSDTNNCWEHFNE